MECQFIDPPEGGGLDLYVHLVCRGHARDLDIEAVPRHGVGIEDSLNVRCRCGRWRHGQGLRRRIGKDSGRSEARGGGRSAGRRKGPGRSGR